ncbi:MAG: type II toxin-antitoxin system death-on-curing family toxin [Burkholderiaceae bacterium]
MEFVWIGDAVLEAVHDAQLAEHGGLVGTRDAGLLASALARPKNLAAYGDPDVCRCADAYGFGIARNHPFVDGNKRTAFVAMALFLELNAMTLSADDAECVVVMLGVADGSIDEHRLAEWLRTHVGPHAKPRAKR